MFKVGKFYDFRMIEDGDEVRFGGYVEAYEHPLLKLEGGPERENPVRLMPGPAPGEAAPTSPGKIPGYPGQIINVTSPNFISAVENRH